jgi:hypothetical protein
MATIMNTKKYRGQFMIGAAIIFLLLIFILVTVMLGPLQQVQEQSTSDPVLFPRNGLSFLSSALIPILFLIIIIMAWLGFQNANRSA